MRVCETCGESSADDSAFCGGCGAALPTRKKASRRSHIATGAVAVACACLLVAVIVLRPFSRGGNGLPADLPRSDQEQMAMAMSFYLGDNDDTFPPRSSGRELELRFTRYLHAVPSGTKPMPLSAVADFEWNPALWGMNRNSIGSPEETWVFYRREAIDGYRLVAFVDGHSHAMTEKEVADLVGHPTKVSSGR